jgi:23S rRNA (cytosine1962-C5)-methyltransferase
LRGALDLAEEIAKLNGFSEKVVLIKEDVLNYLKNPSFLADVVIDDPPAFIKSKGDLDQGLRLEEIIKRSLAKLGFRGRIIKKLSQAQDHPINPLVKETYYLKGRVLYLEN